MYLEEHKIKRPKNYQTKDVQEPHIVNCKNKIIEKQKTYLQGFTMFFN